MGWVRGLVWFGDAHGLLPIGHGMDGWMGWDGWTDGPAWPFSVVTDFGLFLI